LIVSHVTLSNSSAKVDFAAVAGARDYRVFDVSAPGKVKYAGMAHLDLAYASDAGNLYCGCHFAMQPDGATPVFPYTTSKTGTGPTSLTVPATEIQWNGLADGQPHTLVVQALDQLGPVPMGALYTTSNTHAYAGGGAMGALGANGGMTMDGHLSINGQGPMTNAPHVIAQSAPFVVRADPSARPLPSSSTAAQTFYDPFTDAASDPIARTAYDPTHDSATYTLGAGTAHPWTIQYQNADVKNSQPFVMDNHFMDVLFDGGTAGTNNPLHQGHGVMALSPQQTADFSGGRLLHLTMEVDAHQSGRRWTAFNLAPATDPLTNWYTSGAKVNTANQAFFAQLSPGKITTDLFNGKDTRITGSLGQASIWSNRTAHWGGNGLALDNRSRFDLFLTQKRFALFEDGQLAVQADIPGGLPFAQAKVYFAHYLYHTANDHNELPAYETYWHDTFPWSDERHWDNMGFEVLPASTVPTASDWSPLASLVKMPTPATPVGAGISVGRLSRQSR